MILAPIFEVLGVSTIWRHTNFKIVFLVRNWKGIPTYQRSQNWIINAHVIGVQRLICSWPKTNIMSLMFKRWTISKINMHFYWKILRCWFSTIYVRSPSTLQLNVTTTIVKFYMKFLILHRLHPPTSSYGEAVILIIVIEDLLMH